MKSYDDIIDMPRWEPANHRRMPMESRAAQFAPFAALSGHDAAIGETARLTDSQGELDSVEVAMLNERMAEISRRISERPEVEVTYFVPDLRKPGGAYMTYRGRVRKVDDCEMVMTFADGALIPIQRISHIEIL